MKTHHLAASLLAALSYLCTLTIAADFFVNTMEQCRTECLDQGYEIFSRAKGTVARCCSEDVFDSEDCTFGGYDTRAQEPSMKYQLCPQAVNCGPATIIVKDRVQTYSISTRTLNGTALEDICHHELQFSVEAGVNDIMRLKFKEVIEGTVVHFAVGLDYPSAQSRTLVNNIVNQQVSVSFPYKIFLTLEHLIRQEGKVVLDFWYVDQSATDEVEESLTDAFQVIEIVDETEEADMTWLFIVGGFAAVIIAVVSALVCVNVYRQKKLEEETMEQREKGLAPTWGVKTQYVYIDQDGKEKKLDLKEDHSDAPLNNNNVSSTALNQTAANESINMLEATAKNGESERKPQVQNNVEDNSAVAVDREANPMMNRRRPSALPNLA